MTIRSAYENELAQSFQTSENFIWLGGTDANSEGNFYWLDGDQQGENFWTGGPSGAAVNGFYSNFSSGQPDDFAGAQDHVYVRRDNGVWDDINSSSLNAYVIEWDASEVLSSFTFEVTDQEDQGPLFKVDPSTGEVSLADPTTPDSYSDHVVWFDPSESGSVTESGGLISGISDLSSTGNDGLQNTSTNQPTLVTAAINGLDAIQFDGVDDLLQISDDSTLNTNGVGYSQKSISVVFQTSNDITNQQVLFKQGGTGSGITIYVQDGQLYAGAYSDSGVTTEAWLSTVVASDTAYVMTLDFDSVDRELKLFLNGEAHGTAVAEAELDSHSGNVVVGASQNTGKTHEGNLSGSASSFFNGLIGEFTYYNESLENSEIVDLHAHLMNKWLGTPTGLDYENATSNDVTVQVTDAAGNSYSEVITIQVDNDLDAMQTVPAAQTIDEDTVLTFTSGTATEVSVTDTLGTVDSRMRVTLTVDNGALTLSQTTGLTFIEGADNSGRFVIDGTESDINAALDGMTFTPTGNFNGGVTLDMSTSLAADLEGQYTFTGGSANDEAAGTVQDGTLNGDATTVIDSTRGEVLSLDGAGDYVTINSTFGEPENVTLSAWVNLTSADTSGAEVITLGSNVILRLDPNATTGLRGYFRNGGTWLTTESTGNLAGTGWNHVAFTVDADSGIQTLYLNGEIVAQSTHAAPIEYNLYSTTYIGRQGSGGSAIDFNGMIDDARVYSRALSAEEIAAMSPEHPTEVLGPDLTQSYAAQGGDTGAANLLFIHDDFGRVAGDGTISSLEIAPDSNNTPIDFDLLVLRPDGGGFEVVHRVSLSDSDITGTNANGVRTLDIGQLAVQTGDVIGHWSANQHGSIPFSLGTGATGYSSYATGDIEVGDTVTESNNSTQARIYGLNFTFEPNSPNQTSSFNQVDITVNAVNDAPTITTDIYIENHSFEDDVLPTEHTGTTSVSG
ncbi:MAG: LamG-like jellyroll fold domain-containing protein, partial [Planctomycetota bacterium]